MEHALENVRKCSGSEMTGWRRHMRKSQQKMKRKQKRQETAVRCLLSISVSDGKREAVLSEKQEESGRSSCREKMKKKIEKRSSLSGTAIDCMVERIREAFFNGRNKIYLCGQIRIPRSLCAGEKQTVCGSNAWQCRSV